MRYNMPAHHFDTMSYRRRTLAARYFLLAAVIFFVLGVALSFAGQSGIAIQNRLVNHQHTASGDGGILQGLSPVGNFKISGNNAGNIAISTYITGSNFIWKPSSTSFIAGQATDDSFYVNNIGGFSWIGGYNSMSRGDYSLAFGTNVKNYRAASIALGYYLQNNAGNSIMFGSGPGFGGSAYAVNNDTGSIKFFPFTTTSETRPMLNMKRDNTAETVGVWNFVSSPTVPGIGIGNINPQAKVHISTGIIYIDGTGNGISIANGGLTSGSASPTTQTIYSNRSINFGDNSGYIFAISGGNPGSARAISIRDNGFVRVGGSTHIPSQATFEVQGDNLNRIVSISTGTNSNNIVVFKTGGLRAYPRTKAQILAITPSDSGEIFYCTDCATSTYCVSTGTVAGQYSNIGNRAGNCE